MADSASEIELESDASSVDGCAVNANAKVPPFTEMEEMQKRIESLQQENKVLKAELEVFKARCRTLQEDNRELRRASVNIQARAEQEEEYISNTLLKTIQSLKKEKETLAVNYEKEEEYLTNDLSRKLVQLRKEKVELEETLEKEQEFQVNKLMKKIEKLEGDILSKQATLEQLKREKVELENALEQEQEASVNRLWKSIEKLEAEKRLLQERLDQPVSAPPSPRDISDGNDVAGNLSQHIGFLRGEVARLKNQLRAAQMQHAEQAKHYAQEERQIREENLRLQRKLQMEIERREALCRHLSESESSLEMDDERHFNEMSKQQDAVMRDVAAMSTAGHPTRPRTISSPIPYHSPGSSRSISPGMPPHSSLPFSPPSPMRVGGSFPAFPHSMPHTSPGGFPSTSPPVYSHMGAAHKLRPSPDKFVMKPPAAPGSRISQPDKTTKKT